MEVKVLREEGLDLAIEGMKLSYHYDGKESLEGQDADYYLNLARKLAQKDNGSNKFLESVVVWINLDAPRYFWQQYDTYRSGMTKQSESTMHTFTMRHVTQADFEDPIPSVILDILNDMVDKQQLDEAKNILPEGFLQRRYICTNYKALRHIVSQRKSHKLRQWHIFIDAILAQVKHPEFLT